MTFFPGEDKPALNGLHLSNLSFTKINSFKLPKAGNQIDLVAKLKCSILSKI